MSMSGFSDLSLYESRLNAISRVREAQEKSLSFINETNNFHGGIGETANRVLNGNQNQNPNFNQAQSFNQNVGGNFKENTQNRQQQNWENQKGQNPPQSRPSTISGILNSILPNKGDGTKKDYGAAIKEQLGEISKPLSRLMEAYDIDSEKLIIIMVMWVLFNEKADKTLLLALGYLLL